MIQIIKNTGAGDGSGYLVVSQKGAVCIWSSTENQLQAFTDLNVRLSAALPSPRLLPTRSASVLLMCCTVHYTHVRAFGGAAEHVGDGRDDAARTEEGDGEHRAAAVRVGLAHHVEQSESGAPSTPLTALSVGELPSAQVPTVQYVMCR